jgi:hypothetical protein
LITDSKVTWCVNRIVTVRPGRWTLVRTPMHPCTPGMAYVSYARIIGQSYDRGAWTRCRSL